MSPDANAPDTVVLIHGFWVTPRSWEEGRDGIDRALATAPSHIRERFRLIPMGSPVEV